MSADYRLHRDRTAPDGAKIGAKRNRLFIAGSQSLYALCVDAQGMAYA